MKNLNASQEVKDRIEALFSELHDLCSENQIPYVASCVTDNDDTGSDQVISVWLNGEEDLVPMSLAAAILNAKGDSLRRRWEGNFAGASAPLVLNVLLDHLQRCSAARARKVRA